MVVRVSKIMILNSLDEICFRIIYKLNLIKKGIVIRTVIYLEQVEPRDRQILEEYWKMHGCVFVNNETDLKGMFALSKSEIQILRSKSRLQIDFGICMNKCGENVSNIFTSQSNFYDKGKSQWDFIFCSSCQSNPSLQRKKCKNLIELQNYRLRIAVKGRLWERISKEEYEIFNLIRVKGVTVFDIEIPIYCKNNFKNLNQTIERFESLGLIETSRSGKNYGVTSIKIPDLILAELFPQEKDKMNIRNNQRGNGPKQIGEIIKSCNDF